MKFSWRPGLAAIALFALGSCALGYDHDEIDASYSVDPEFTATTKLGRAADHYRGDAPSAFHLLDNGRSALVGRGALIQAAEHSIDVQVYIFRGMTGGLLLERMMAAADRGVRVRLLLDDIGTGDRDDLEVAALSLHPNVEVRIYNPVRNRDGIGWSIEALFEFNRVNRRMHNKMMIADSQATIIGGRNIGDEYFDAGEVAFQDLDVLGFGQVAADASTVFDEYWNSEWSIPAKMVARGTPEAEKLETVRALLAEAADRARGTPYIQYLIADPMIEPMLSGALPMVRASGAVVADDPAKFTRSSEVVGKREKRRVEGLGMETATRELLIVSPYFIPRASGVAALNARVAAGVDVRILTNSLAATDVPLVHVGYADSRRPLLRGGVDLREMKPRHEDEDEEGNALTGSSSASLHAKTFVFDRERVFIGSLNLDPRSIEINTESGVLVESVELAEQVAALFERWNSSRMSWRLEFDDGGLVWIDRTADGVERRTSSEPGKSFLQALGLGLIGVLPIESQL